MKRKILDADRESLLEKAKRYKKIDATSLALEEPGLKQYFSELDLNQARIKFRERSKCMSTCKRHYSSDFHNIRTMFSCQSCVSGSVDVLSHWKICDSYKVFRESRNLDKDTDLVSYYQDIIAFRNAEMDK